MASKRSNKSESVLKNHVLDLDTKTLQNVLKERFGFGIDDLQAVLDGDKDKAKAIAEFGKKGRIASKYAPKVAQAILDGIEGTKELNVQTASLLKSAGSANLAIEKAGQGTLLANQKYNHQRSENALEYDLANNQEGLRHDYAKTYIESKYFYDTYFMTVDADTKQLDQTNRPEVKQITEDERYEQAVMDHLLAHGDSSQVDLVSQRDYLESSHSDSGILDTVKNFIGAIKSGAGW